MPSTIIRTHLGSSKQPNSVQRPVKQKSLPRINWSWPKMVIYRLQLERIGRKGATRTATSLNNIICDSIRIDGTIKILWLSEDRGSDAGVEELLGNGHR